MWIKEMDFPLIMTFLDRESRMYRWSHPINRHVFIAHMYRAISNNMEAVEAADYVRIQSISNLGLLNSEIRLTGYPWKQGIEVIMCLPPSPRGGVSYTVVKKSYHDGNRSKTKS